MPSKHNKKLIDPRRWPGVMAYKSSNKRLHGRPDICYYIRYGIPGGKNRTEKVGWKSEGYTPQIASEIRAERIRKKRHGDDVKTAKEIALERQMSDRTLGEITEIYFEERKTNLKGITTDLNRYELHIEPLFKKRPVSSIAPLDVDRIKHNMKFHATATVANTLELLRRLINFGVKKGLCDTPGFIIEIPKKDNEVTEYLEPEEAERLLSVLDGWKSQCVPRMLKTAMLTGLRRGEIFNLKDKDLDFNQDLIKLRDPKGGKSTSIPMSEPVKGLLKEQIDWRKQTYPKSNFIFPGLGGKKRTDCSAVRRIKAKAKLPTKFRIFHGLRHHFAVTLANSGEFSLDMIGELLTHKSTAMTKRYAQFLPITMKKASNRAAELINKSTSKDPERTQADVGKK